MQPWWDWFNAYALRWESAWSIVGAIGSAAAAGVAVWLAKREGDARAAAEKQLNDERNERRAEKRAAEYLERSRLARMISVSQTVPGEDWARPKVRIANHGQLPVFDVQFHAAFMGEQPTFVHLGRWLDSLGPGDSSSLRVNSEVLRENPNRYGDFLPFVVFRDNNGVAWAAFAFEHHLIEAPSEENDRAVKEYVDRCYRACLI
ncbi:hypothetical protein CTKZ_27330 [Cellulomonas algicola]|uniref:Uncharacterized protein n=1 Tax=Cellulomonas algicola TaxID=2071633 RepID=A0A401V2Q7_9CELL|nr:hypothetical protein [Cellulomonas algicola]GCD21171.1 hypothetical protein CTKZ_27330 [Cellulomonas algicola]